MIIIMTSIITTMNIHIATITIISIIRIIIQNMIRGMNLFLKICIMMSMNLHITMIMIIMVVIVGDILTHLHMIIPQ